MIEYLIDRLLLAGLSISFNLLALPKNGNLTKEQSVSPLVRHGMLSGDMACVNLHS